METLALVLRRRRNPLIKRRRVNLRRKAKVIKKVIS